MGSSIGELYEDLKIAHTYTFLTKNFYGFETVFCIMILGFSPYFICVLCRAKILPQIYARIISSLKPPPYTRIICEKISPQIYRELRCVWNLWVRLIYGWYLGVRLYHFFVYAVIVWRRLFLLIGWCQSLIVKAWWDFINSL